MTPKQKLKLAYKVAERLHLLPLLDEEVDAIFFCLDLIKEEDVKH
jgi:hypothetical protein